MLIFENVWNMEKIIFKGDIFCLPVCLSGFPRTEGRVPKYLYFQCGELISFGHSSFRTSGSKIQKISFFDDVNEISWLDGNSFVRNRWISNAQHPFAVNLDKNRTFIYMTSKYWNSLPATFFRNFYKQAKIPY